MTTSDLIPRLVFVTDPMCSWCWGMADDVERVRQEFAGSVACDLMVGGINVESQNVVSERALGRFEQLWRNVTAVTGQTFSMQLPASGKFVYNSLPACRAVVAARRLTAAPPFEYLYLLQKALFVDARDTSDVVVLQDIAGSMGVDENDFLATYHDAACASQLNAEIGSARKFGTRALPAVLIDAGDGLGLLAGGYVQADMLIEQVRSWLQLKA